MNNIIYQNSSSDGINNYYDKESIEILKSLPSKVNRNALYYFIKIINATGYALYGIGAISLGAIAYTNMVNNKGFNVIEYLIPVIPLIIGYFCQQATIPYIKMADKTKIKGLSLRLINYLLKEDRQNAVIIAEQIILCKTNEEKAKGYHLAKALSYKILASEAEENSLTMKKAKFYARRTIKHCNNLKKLSVETPLSLYLFADSNRIAKKEQG